VDVLLFTIDGVELRNWRDNLDVAHVEYRDDRFVVALSLDDYGSSDLFYLARAVTPGDYRIPPPYIEDMYRPYRHALGTTPETLRITR
jgi:alpha-2-macroglobulin